MRARLSPTGFTTGDPDARVLQALLGSGKIAAIKLCRELHPGMDLAEAKKRVDELEKTLPPQAQLRAGGCLLMAAALLTFAAGCGIGALL